MEVAISPTSSKTTWCEAANAITQSKSTAFIISFYETEGTYARYYRQDYDLWIGCVAPLLSVETPLAVGQLPVLSIEVANVEPVKRLQMG